MRVERIGWFVSGDERFPSLGYVLRRSGSYYSYVFGFWREVEVFGGW